MGFGLNICVSFAALMLFASATGLGEAPAETPELLSAEHKNIAREIWATSVPVTGQSLTVEGEMIRAVEKLRDEAQRNGNGNRDEGHMILADFLMENLANDPMFTAQQRGRIKDIIGAMEQSDSPILDDEPYDYLTSRIAEYYGKYGSQTRAINPELKR